ncbi:PREDICTED: uncharacterized protein LOC109147777 [Ipomoea nil]|uniref:uncharacterized protein LOC109147777 n=1 Tax=Ipomoea nil TaxID=35883 RepID=UPI00090168F5|nr:PREDICTED: uncharacterized protein LOC109147777 [Ipomoea nil]
MGLQERLWMCGQGLKKWGGDHFQKFGSRIDTIRRDMNALRGRMDSVSLGQFRQLDGQLCSILSQEETFWKQRAKQHWLQGADRNTKFFHQYATYRKRKNFVMKLKDENGAWKEGDGLTSLVTSYYEQIFQSSGGSGAFHVDTLTPRVTREQNDDLLRPFEPEEVKRALFSMGKDKSPGPDGMNPGFYQAFWDLIGKDVTDFVLNCLSQSSFPLELNDANIVLIPKKAAPEFVADLRPIALCNVVYKLMAKMIANRMKPLLDNIISESQSAFLPSRLISDNILIASEVGHYLRRKQLGRVGWAALKLDMAKAYDRMEWSFVERMLLGLGFDGKWVSLIMLCVRTVRYRVLVNGKPSKEIIPSRGLRQGDPLSPYLFIICAEGLSLLLQDAQTKGRIHGCRVARGAPPISHLFFADDSLLFFKANMQETLEVKRCLTVYKKFSGQSVNFHKSNISFSRNTVLGDRNDIANGLGVEQAEDFGKYLGLPSVIGRNRKVVFSYVEKKLRQRFGSWNKRLLSVAGKEVLLKSVAQAMPTYTMSIYLLPMTLCVSLERLMNRYWWGKSNVVDGIHWMAWDKMCVPKKHGGMGFKRLHEFNLALLGKQGWRMLTCPDSLVARIFKARYFPNTTFYEATLGGNPSYVWRSIIASQDLVRSGCRLRIGNGRMTRVWDHPWLPDSHDPFVHSDQPAQHPDLMVADLINYDQGIWNQELISQIFIPRDAGLILQTPVCVDFKDDWYWTGDIRGMYTVKNGYRRLGEINAPCDAIWNNIWKLQWVELWLGNSAISAGFLKDQICGILYEIWRARNMAVWDLALPSPIHLCVSFHRTWSAWTKSTVHGSVAPLPSHITALPSPASEVLPAMQHEDAASLPHDAVLCSTDAGFYGSQHAPTFGFYVRSPEGVFIAAVNGPLSCPYDPLLAEAMAIQNNSELFAAPPGVDLPTAQTAPPVPPAEVSTPAQVQPVVDGVHVGSPLVAPVVVPIPAQVQPPLSGAQVGSVADGVAVFPSLNTRASPKHLVSQLKWLNANGKP